MKSRRTRKLRVEATTVETTLATLPLRSGERSVWAPRSWATSQSRRLPTRR